MDLTHSLVSDTGTATGRWLRVLRRTGVALIAAVLAAMAVESVLARRDATRYPAPGQLVELADGRRLHLQVAGTAHDGPTVVFESGAGSFSSQWAWVQGRVAEFAPTVAYDRPGLGWSDPYRTDWDASTVAADLAAALDRLDLPKPYVMVGHSLGATYARVFAHHERDDVAGLVLVDPGHEDQFDIVGGADLKVLRATHVAARLGLLRLLRPLDDIGATMPADTFAAWTAHSYSAAGTGGFLEEGRTVLRTIAPQVQALDVDLGNLPVTVLRAAEAEWPDVAAMRELQGQLAELSTRGELFDVPGADHYSIVADPEHAATVADAIGELLSTAERG